MNGFRTVERNKTRIAADCKHFTKNGMEMEETATFDNYK